MFLCRDSASDTLLDLDVFNFGERSRRGSSARRSDGEDEDDPDDNCPLFYQPGKRGFYSPRQGKCTPERLNAFRNVGRILGLCLLQNELCPIYLNRHVIKYILGRRIRWHDLAFFDPVLYESLRQVVIDAEGKDCNTVFSALDLTFCIDLSIEEVCIYTYQDILHFIYSFSLTFKYKVIESSLQIKSNILYCSNVYMRCNLFFKLICICHI